MSRVIHYFPLEHLESRYTTHLDDSIRSYLVRKKKKFTYYYPNLMGLEQTAPPKGMFLNAWATCLFKANQLKMISLAYASGKIKDKDILFFSDLWFPGIEMVRYMDHFFGIKTEIRGLLHAGSFTDTDEVRKLERWAMHFEAALFDIVDKVYVGSEFMKSDVCQKRPISREKVIATRFPIDPELKAIKPCKKKNLVIFNGRNHPEKQPWLFDQLKKEIGNDVEFIKTCDHSFSREEYLQLLNSAKVVVSFALQENFGFGLIEAATLGCIPVVPDRLVYPEFFPSSYRYRTFDQCVRIVKKALKGEIKTVDFGNKFSEKQIISEWFK